MKAARKRAKERFALRVDVALVEHNALSERIGCLIPADSYTQRRLRELGYKRGDLVFSEFFKPRNPLFHRLAHRIGTLCVRSIEAFAGMDAHDALKKLQLDAAVECEESRAIVPDVGVMTVLTPISLAFESMEEGRFQAFVRRVYDHIAHRYWPDMSAEDISTMVDTYSPEDV